MTIDYSTPLLASEDFLKPNNGNYGNSQFHYYYHEFHLPIKYYLWYPLHVPPLAKLEKPTFFSKLGGTNASCSSNPLKDFEIFVSSRIYLMEIWGSTLTLPKTPAVCSSSVAILRKKTVHFFLKDLDCSNFFANPAKYIQLGCPEIFLRIMFWIVFYFAYTLHQ